jgi:hypothetical protein
MPCLSRLINLFKDRPALTSRRVTAPISEISAIVCLYKNWQIARFEIDRLSRYLNLGLLNQGLQALERVCVLVRVTDALADVVRQQAKVPRAPLASELLATFDDWREDVRRELPAAAMHLCTIAGGSIDAVSSVLRQLDAMLSSASASAVGSAS